MDVAIWVPMEGEAMTTEPAPKLCDDCYCDPCQCSDVLAFDAVYGNKAAPANTPLSRLIDAVKYFLAGYEDCDDWQEPGRSPGGSDCIGWYDAMRNVQDALAAMPPESKTALPPEMVVLFARWASRNGEAMNHHARAELNCCIAELRAALTAQPPAGETKATT